MLKFFHRKKKLGGTIIIKEPIAKVGYFDASSFPTGNYSVTGLGFKPKLIEFFVCKNDGLEVRVVECLGWADNLGNQNCSAWGIGPQIAPLYSNMSLSNCIFLINTSGVVILQATLASMDNDGFTLNFSVAGTTALGVRWKAIG